MEKVSSHAAGDFLRKAVMSNVFVIESSKIAREKTHNRQIREFAERMIQDHGALGARLMAAASPREVKPDLDAEHERMLQPLRGASGANFDRAYARAQVQIHRDVVETYSNYSQSGDDPALRKFAQETLPGLREHLRTIQQIQNGLEPGAPGPAQRNGQEQIIVEHAATSVRVHQAAPQVTVEQAQPSVTVRQPHPEILVRQPQPVITVEVPRPEIIVRMPQPEVRIAMEQPRVEVTQMQPQVQVIQAHAPVVEIEQAQPMVHMASGASSSPRVDILQAEGIPAIRYEGMEPRVIVKQAQGQADVRFERVGEARISAARSGAAAPETRETRTAATRQAAATAGSRTVSASQLMGMSLFDMYGNEIGSIKRIVTGRDGESYAVTGIGGFLGIGEHDLAFPLRGVSIQDGNLILSGLTREEIGAMPAFKAGESYIEAGADQELRLRQEL